MFLWCMLFTPNIEKIYWQITCSCTEFLARPEMENLNTHTHEISKKAKVSMKGLSRSSLHAKLMALDEKQVFIGSFNS